MSQWKAATKNGHFYGEPEMKREQRKAAGNERWTKTDTDRQAQNKAERTRHK